VLHVAKVNVASKVKGVAMRWEEKEVPIVPILS